MRNIPNNWPEGLSIPPPIPKQYFEDERWMSDHMDELLERYPDQWVAVVHGEVVASGKVLAEVEREAEERTGEKEFPVELIQPGIVFHSNYRIL